jgi:hypothetical protein
MHQERDRHEECRDEGDTQCGLTPRRMLMPPRMIIRPDTITASFGDGTPFEPVKPAIIGRCWKWRMPRDDEEPAEQHAAGKVERM